MVMLPIQQKFKISFLFIFFLCLPVHSFELIEVDDNFFVHYGKQEEINKNNKGDIANLGFIVGDKSVAVIDAGSTLEISTQLINSIKNKTTLPISHLIITHGHPDHFMGGYAFKKYNPVVIGHENLERSLNMNFNFYKTLLATNIEDKSILNIKPLLPTLKIQKNQRLKIDIGNRIIEIKAWKSGHTDNDLSVYDNNSKILWTENIFIKRIPSIRASVIGWKKNLEETLSMDVSKIIPGHGKIMDKKKAIGPMLEYFNSLINEVRFFHKNGHSLEETLQNSKIKNKNWLLFDDYHQSNIIKVYSELEWE